mmetsp:Transcript_119947/g.189957  ORF Transcript_119947/g.189957 Transcript_119947/m.189957 type:complete len:101 (+) Transcript_119947:1414-1716(+)
MKQDLPHWLTLMRISKRRLLLRRKCLRNCEVASKFARIECIRVVDCRNSCQYSMQKLLHYHGSKPFVTIVSSGPEPQNKHDFVLQAVGLDRHPMGFNWSV